MFLSSCTGITLTRQNFVDTSGSNNRQPNNSNPSSNQETLILVNLTTKIQHVLIYLGC
ncbi:putative hypothetical lipoprotein domain protein [Mycoplasmoides gallisepticum CA06_2006.052-5-2P]|uniref:Putative hypothetical lipoprotein domain protein n=1 Tax=Mycoplasmoides gallisepticum WI01_2001.043-13-2P TaxID=1159201 RepID=J3VHN1_MYCGL|nr:hypothetical protein [Mycoplasmoides gallisepticum]AFP76285.1 putative hypothetical lipoprotein domain protein [Mycoplasmoides gallisepticum VA94_7994-1-7P]AFP77053.1 putative hypothetical lipoprotein domain protein [Mycoplasmoides gallisepticum NC95_13295-2-2P]AFP77811.1 putative hypothetical lipoprotein domain protein [Mycoplasmoides gallisepticum NC96_1596-4-2P]AFP79338.1 putative hypothetical lipoprotein domain protein [Mycoplasmoides gallisepticum WI01_2001.043-13-2P]AFP80827.1 putativ